MVVDFAFIVEGKDDKELPEQVLGCCRCFNLDFNNGWLLDAGYAASG